MDQRTCSAPEGCDRTEIVALGLCRKHYNRKWRHGDPSVVLPHYRKHSLNHAYFDDITTPEQAYWLGFLAADGGITKRRGYVLKLELAQSDGDHVWLFRDAIGSSVTPFRRSKGSGSLVLAVNSRHMVESLERLGISERKSLTAEPWPGPASLMPHYWRGLFDGDGSIFRTGTRKTGALGWMLTVVGSLACMEAFAEWGRSVSGATGKLAATRACPDIWRWTTGGGPTPQRLAEALYGSAPVALERKRLLAEELIGADFAAVKADADSRRAASAQDAWANNVGRISGIRQRKATRQRQVVELRAQGLPMHEIATRLNISIGTVHRDLTGQVPP